jgi:hypothetical protein
MTAEFGPTNVVIDAKDIIQPEDMTPNQRIVILPNGDTKFVIDEEYQDGYYA